MSETKDDIAADRDRLAAELAAARAQLAGAGRTATAGPYQPSQQFQLSEGARQELEIYGVVNIGGRLWTREEVLDELGPDTRVKIAEPSPELDRREQLTESGVTGPGIRGIDYVYPSVERGKIDPAVAGTPGISGPAKGE